MKRYESSYNPAVKDISDYIHNNELKQGLHPVMVTKIKNVLDGVEVTDNLLVQKEQLLGQKDNQLNQFQQIITTKTSEIQSKNSLLTQKEQLLLQKEKLLSELRIKEENQLKEEYISVLHQLNPKVFSANYEDWNDKAQAFKDIIDQGKLKTIRKKLPVYKQQLAQKIETEKLALATKEAERLDNAKQEVVSILNQLHPHSYPANFEEWSTHPATQNSRAKALLDSNNLGAIEKKLVHYRELLKQEVQNKAQLILQKEQEFKSLNDTFTSSILTKEEELKSLHDTILAKNTAISEVSHKVKKKNRKLAQEIQSKNQLALQKELEKEELRIQKEQEIERLREELACKEVEAQEKDALLLAKELEKQEPLIQKEKEKEELLALKENELREKEELLLAKESEVHNKSAEKNRIIEELESNLLTKDEELTGEKLKSSALSHKVKKANRKLATKEKQKLEELKLLIEQNRIEKEELLAQKELSIANKSHMKNQIIDELEEEINLQEDEVGNLRIQNLEKELMNQKQEKLLIQKDIELENLLEQKDEEVRNKSLVKNQIIGGLRETMTEKEKEALNLKIELLMKQVEFHKKESELKDKANELKDKALADAHLINELQEKLLAFQNLSKHDETLKLELSVIHFKVEESIVNGNLDEMKELSKYLSELMKDHIEKDESLEISELLNLSPIVHGGENLVQQNVPVVNHGNFDINQMHITHSVLLGGEGSESFEIIKDESLN
jgi:DNA-binding XRE family transcriptional regulator